MSEKFLLKIKKRITAELHHKLKKKFKTNILKENE